MLNDITFGQYYKADSFFHRLDARTKLIVTLLFIVIIFLCKNFLSIGLMIVFLFACMLLSRVPLKMYFKSLKPIIPIIVFTFVLNVFYSAGGDVLWSYWKIVITTKGLATAFFVSVRILCLIVSSSILTYTTMPTDLTDAIEKLLSPLKVFHADVHTLAMMMTLALRFIPTLIDEINRITNAQKARGADFENGKLLDRVRAMIPILIPLFVSAFNRAYELAFAMNCRCYNGGKGRTRMKQPKMHFADFAVLFVFVAAGAGVVLLNHYFGKLI